MKGKFKLQHAGFNQGFGANARQNIKGRWCWRFSWHAPGDKVQIEPEIYIILKNEYVLEYL